MAVLGVSCLNTLNVLGGFFVSGRRLGTIGVLTVLGVTSHGVRAESIECGDLEIGVVVSGMESLID